MKTQTRFISFKLRPFAFLLVGALAIWLGGGWLDLAAAKASYDDPTTAEGWAWSQIQQGGVADFSRHCDAEERPPDPKVDDVRWKHVCRTLTARFLQDLLVKAPWREGVPFGGVRIKGARIIGNIELEGANPIRPIEIVGSRIEGAVNLRRVRTESFISFDGSVIRDAFDAEGLRSESDLSLGNGAVFMDDVSLKAAKIDGRIDMDGASVNGTLNAENLRLGITLHMASRGENKATYNEVILRGAKVTGLLSMDGAKVEGTLNADNLQVGGALHMRSQGVNNATFKRIILRSAKIAGQLSMIGATVDGEFNGEFLQVGGSFLMRSEAENAIFKNMDLHSSHVAGSLDLRGATLANVDLSTASIGADFMLGSTVWTGVLNLRNAHIGNLMDEQDGAWPNRQGQLLLDGFTFNRLGGHTGETETQMRMRGMIWWDKWARLDPDYSPFPYAQLAAAWISSGDRDAANEIRYFGREREREEAWKRHHWGTWLFQTILRDVAGYGIGFYTFRVLGWVLSLSLAFAALLWWFSPGTRNEPKGAFWCFGASLSRLLPVIELNKEFTDFFNDPTRQRLTFWPTIVFSALGIIGWILGAVLIVALSSLTQSQ